MSTIQALPVGSAVPMSPIVPSSSTTSTSPTVQTNVATISVNPSGTTNQTSIASVTPSATAGTPAQVQYISNKIISTIGGSINKDNIIHAVLQGLMIMRSFVACTGDQKKQILIQTLETLVSNTSLPTTEQQFIDNVITFIVPNAIDAFVYIANSKIVLEVETKCGCLGASTATNPV